MKRILFALFLAGSLITPAVYSTTVYVEDISNRLYYPVLLRELNNAKHSIDIAMYALYYHADEPQSLVATLIKALTAAKARGVRVRVFLNNDKGNREAYGYLKEQGIDVRFIKKGVKLHAKLIIIDNETVIDGSANWTDNAVNLNFESNMIVRAGEFAREKNGFFNQLELYVEDDTAPQGVKMPEVFLRDKRLAAIMARDNDYPCFDFYLFLTAYCARNKTDSYYAPYQEIARRAGFGGRNYDKAYAWVGRIVARMEKKYDLITHTTDGKRGYVINPRKIGGDSFVVPWGYWDYGLDKMLIGEKFAYLAFLCEQQRAGWGKWWAKSGVDLAKNYPMSASCYGKIISKLADRDLFDIHRPVIAPEVDFKYHGASQYRLKPLISGEERVRLWGEFAKANGKEKADTVRRMAEAVCEINDIDAAQDFIRLIDEYGQDEVENAVKKVAGYRRANSRRSIDYVIGILRSRAREANTPNN